MPRRIEQVRPGRIGSDRVRSSQVGSGQARSGQVRSGQVAPIAVWPLGHRDVLLHCIEHETKNWYRDSSVVTFSRIDPMVSGSNPPSAKISIKMRRVASSL